MFFWFAPEVVIDGPMPELLNMFPGLNLSAPDDIIEVVRLTLLDGLLANKEVQLWVGQFGLFCGGPRFLKVKEDLRRSQRALSG